MELRSSRTPALRAGIEEAVFSGLAPDGGLYVPSRHPDLRDLARRWGERSSFASVASDLSRAILSPDLRSCDAEEVAARAFDFEPVLRQLGGELYVLELFHGRSCAFKDFGASFLASLMDFYCAREDRRATVLVATSGDTGSAVAQAFRGRRKVSVVILYPSGRVSQLQEKQLTTVGGNVCALEVKGSFDDCQRMVKEAFLDRPLAHELSLTSANSINVGRFLPQSFYYFWSWAALGGAGRPELSSSATFVVPCGNLGNLASGLYAWKWGMQVSGFLAASNANDVLPEYLETGSFRPRPSVATLSNAMDVGNPSNMERILELFSGDQEEASGLLRGWRVSDAETLEGIRRAYGEHGYVMDPHTAVGYAAEAALVASRGGGRHGPVVLLATAHPAKFVETVERALGFAPELPAALREASAKPKSSVEIEPRIEALSDFLRRDLERHLTPPD